MRDSRRTNLKTNRVSLTDTQPKPVSVLHIKNRTDMNNNLIPQCESGTILGRQDIYQYDNGIVDWECVCIPPTDSLKDEFNCPPWLNGNCIEL